MAQLCHVQLVHLEQNHQTWISFSKVTAGQQGFEGQGAGTGGYLAAGCHSRRRDLWRHFREDIFMEALTGRGQRCSHPTGTPAQLSHPGMTQGTSPTPSLPHLLTGW